MGAKELIEKLQRMKELVSEYQETKESEKYEYVMKYEYELLGLKYYSLLERNTNNVMIDTQERLMSWMNLRNIDTSRYYFTKNNLTI